MTKRKDKPFEDETPGDAMPENPIIETFAREPLPDASPPTTPIIDQPAAMTVRVRYHGRNPGVLASKLIYNNETRVVTPAQLAAARQVRPDAYEVIA